MVSQCKSIFLMDTGVALREKGRECKSIFLMNIGVVLREKGREFLTVREKGREFLTVQNYTCTEA